MSEVKPHRGVRVHPAHTVKGVDHHKKMHHYPTAQKHSGYSTREPHGAGIGQELPGMDGIAGCMDGGSAGPSDGEPMGGGMVESGGGMPGAEG